MIVKRNKMNEYLIKQFLNDEFPDLRVLQFDRDTTSIKDGHRDILAKYSKGDTDILVGTSH